MSRLPAVCDYASALDFLLRQINYERTTAIPYRSAEFKLDRMRRLLQLLGDPHLAVRAIHIAGTKGKGSAAAMLAGILQAAGLRTGLYTSPHLDRIEERIAIDGRICSEAEFAGLTSELEHTVLALTDDPDFRDFGGPTFFEITTAMAFLYFARANVDVAVLEVGLGGRLDSTNVCQPFVSIITSISFDHTRQLGSTLAAIAGEKAGIIKPGVPVVSGVTASEPQAVIREVAANVGTSLIERGTAFNAAPSGEACLAASDNGRIVAAGSRFDYWQPAEAPTWQLRGLALGMPGLHQIDNGALAIAAACELAKSGWNISEGAIRAGLASARCPGRIEFVAGRPNAIFDVAHNVASVQALVEFLQSQPATGRRLLLFASSKDKDTAGMLSSLLPAFDEVIVTQYVNNPRAVEAASLAELAADLARGQGRPNLNIYHAFDPTAAWQLARQLCGGDDLVCIAGSFFLVAELRSHVLREQTGMQSKLPSS